MARLIWPKMVEGIVIGVCSYAKSSVSEDRFWGRSIQINLDLHSEWMKYVFEYPDVLDKMSKGAVLVILPEDDKELHDENYKVSEENKKKGIPVFIVTMKMSKPQISNIEVITVWQTFCDA